MPNKVKYSIPVDQYEQLASLLNSIGERKILVASKAIQVKIDRLRKQRVNRLVSDKTLNSRFSK